MGLAQDESFDDDQLSIDFIRQVYWCNGWIPLAHDGGGNHVGIDLDPPKGGARGQVINFGRNERIKFVLAPTWDAFLAQLAGDLEVGQRYRASRRSLRFTRLS